MELTAYAARFIAAFTSRSWSLPHFGQFHVLIDIDNSDKTNPQFEHVLLLAKKRSATINFTPLLSALYSNCRRISRKPISAIERAKRRFLTIPNPFKSSIQIVLKQRTSLVVN